MDDTTGSKQRATESRMLDTLHGVANTMIRGCNRCFEMFPTLLTEQAYRRQVVEILQEPKAYILELENGGQGVPPTTAIPLETTVVDSPKSLLPQAESSRKTNLAIMREIGRNMETSRATMTEEDVLYELRDEPFPLSRTQKCSKILNESQAFFRILSHATAEAARRASKALGETHPSAECGHTEL